MQRDKESKPACSTVSAAVPDEVRCTKCGLGVEMWSDETEVACPGCGHKMSK